jgi:8-oxo-dGTP pyrophosphatase MutT (NUDIX family)
MSSEWWALIGVVVGGMLGGGAQIVAGSLQEKRRHQQWLRERRVDVYQMFITEWRQHYVPLVDFVFDDVHYGPDPPEDYLVPVFSRADEVEIFGSQPAVAAALVACKRLMTFWYADAASREEENTGAQEAIADFTNQVRRDLVG